MVTVAIGPKNTKPSWKWVGEGLLKGLSKSFSSKEFRQRAPKADVTIFVKYLPTNRIENLIYCPIDFLRSESFIKKHKKKLRWCDLILSHSESLIPYLSNYAPTHLIEHHGKYTLPQMVAYKEKGYILWIGGYQFVPHVLHWLQAHPLPL
jgi:hypothetical protein